MPQFVFLWFGPAPWGAALDPEDEEFRAERIPAPVGQVCIWCEVPIEEGDSGQLSPVGSSGQIAPQHRECLLLHTAGHQVGLCTCTNYGGLSQREAALECDRRYQALRSPLAD